MVAGTVHLQERACPLLRPQVSLPPWDCPDLHLPAAPGATYPFTGRALALEDHESYSFLSLFSC